MSTGINRSPTGRQRWSKRDVMIAIVEDQVWNSIQENLEYNIVLVGPTFVRLKSMDNENLVVTVDKERLYEYFQKSLEERPAEVK